MKRTFPLIITAVAGFVLIVSFFVPPWMGWGEDTAIWFDILAAIAFILGGGNLLKLHLKNISNKKAGWGYSAVTIVAFLATLAFGLFKLGSPPASKTEYYGKTFATLPLSAMPEYRIRGTIPKRADGERLPDSVLRQLREEAGEIVFQGWMSPGQRDDLLGYKDILEWQCRVENLFDSAQPDDLPGVSYFPEFESLSIDGVLTQELRDKIESALPASETLTAALDDLQERTTRETSIDVAEFPDGFTIPDSHTDRLSRTDSTLSLIGPMSTGLRDDVARKWADFPPVMPRSREEKDELLEQIENLGGELNPAQRDQFNKFFNADWQPEEMIVALNSAGTPPAGTKSACDLLAEQNAGESELDPVIPAAEPTLLNAQQQAAIRQFAKLDGISREELKSQLSAAGTITPAQLAAVDTFIDGRQRQAEQLQKLGLKLLEEGPLTSQQQEFLFAPIAEMVSWRTDIGRLFIAAHQEKFPWSGDYTAEGNWFWWDYEYVLQPLMTTTFAMLAFYVASAAFRAFRAKNLEATLLLGTAFIVLLGRTYLGVQLTAWVPDTLSALKIDQMTVYIMKIFNTAGNRAIMIGIALGLASTSLKVLLGIDRSYLGSGDD